MSSSSEQDSLSGDSLLFTLANVGKRSAAIRRLNCLDSHKGLPACIKSRQHYYFFQHFFISNNSRSLDETFGIADGHPQIAVAVCSQSAWCKALFSEKLEGHEGQGAQSIRDADLARF